MHRRGPWLAALPTDYDPQLPRYDIMTRRELNVLLLERGIASCGSKHEQVARLNTAGQLALEQFVLAHRYQPDVWYMSKHTAFRSYK